jgi:hypothetical protein
MEQGIVEQGIVKMYFSMGILLVLLFWDFFVSILKIV